MPLSSLKISHKDYLSRQIRDLRRVAVANQCDAATVVGSILHVWKNAAFPELRQSTLPISSLLLQEKKVQRFVELLKALDFLEAIYWLSSVYATVGDKDYRKQLAMYFTPPSLTKGLLDDLAEQGITFTSGTFIDPACGGAAFLSPIAMHMRDALTNEGKKSIDVLLHIERHLFGAEKDPVLCRLCNEFLHMSLYKEITASGYVPTFKVLEANSLAELSYLYNQMDVVVCNPPYRKMIADEVEQLRQQYEEVIEGQPNLYGLFINLCVRLLKKGGYAALVTPTSFFSGQDFSKLRKLLIRETEVAHIGMVSDRQGVFIDVEQETALTVVKKPFAKEGSTVRSVVSLVSATGQYKRVGVCTLPDGGCVWPIPRSIEDVPLLLATASSVFRICDYGYRARIGSYVWNRDKRPRFRSIEDVRQTENSTALPLLWSSDISIHGTVEFDDSGNSKEEHCFVDLGDKKHSSAVFKPSVILQRVTSNDQRRRLIAAPVPDHIYERYGGYVGENHVVILEQIDNDPVLNTAEMARLLTTGLIDRNFRCISGATNVSVFELRQLPLPNPKLLQEELKNGASMEDAARRALGL